jgi:metal-responsive CopG/Arc/MetJ family transcriptional regulator
MTGKGRPRIGTVICVRLPDDLLARIDLEADILGISRAEYVRNILNDYLRNLS